MARNWSSMGPIKLHWCEEEGVDLSWEQLNVYNWERLLQDEVICADGEE